MSTTFEFSDSGEFIGTRFSAGLSDFNITTKFQFDARFYLTNSL